MFDYLCAIIAPLLPAAGLIPMPLVDVCTPLVPPPTLVLVVFIADEIVVMLPPPPRLPLAFF